MASVRQDRILSCCDVGWGLGGGGGGAGGSDSLSLGSGLGRSWLGGDEVVGFSGSGFGVGGSGSCFAVVGSLMGCVERSAWLLGTSRISTAAMMIVSFTRQTAAIALSISTIMLDKLPALSSTVDCAGSTPVGNGSPSVRTRLFDRHVNPVSEAILRAFLIVMLSL